MPDRPWWQTAVIYQIYPRSFQDSNGDGIGDLPGIASRLDYLADLGIDAVWLSPFYPSPQADFGYDVADYCDVDPKYGTLDDFDRLVEETHRRGLRLIVDLVPNHSSDQHPWFVESRSSRDNPKRDWYVWRDGKPDGSPPNNWLSNFGGPAWTFDGTTGQCYLHSFLPEQPDLNWRNPAVEEAMFDAVRFWLDRGVDGFRIDVAHRIMKDPELRDNPPNPAGWSGAFKDLGEYETQLHVNDMGHPDVHDVYRRLRTLLDSYTPHRFAVGEIHLFDMEEWASYYGAGDELHMPYNFSMVYVPWRAADVRERVDALEAAIPQWAWPNYVLGNHDETRLADRFGPHRTRAAAMLLLTLRGTPTLYYGDEVGMGQVDIAPGRQQDPWGRRVPGLGRDGSRTPMQWDASPNAGFTDPGVEPWLPVNDHDRGINVAAQAGDPASLLAFYRRLLSARRTSAALRWGDYRPITNAGEDCLVFLREAEEERVLVAINFADGRRPVALPSGPGRVLVDTDGPGWEAVDLADLELGPDQGLVIRLGDGR